MIKYERVSAIIRDAGGTIVGKSRLQKTAYLRDVVGFKDGFQFDNKHYGPFSEDLANEAIIEIALGGITEKILLAPWGGEYTVYSTQAYSNKQDAKTPSEKALFTQQAASAGAVALELAATAVFLSLEGQQSPWEETVRRKPEKADKDHLKLAQDILVQLRKIKTPAPLPMF